MRWLFIVLLIFSYINSKELININFKDLELMELINITSKQLDKNILVSQEIKGKVNFISSKPIKSDNLLSILKFSLENNGYRLLKRGVILQVVKKNDISNKDYHKKLKITKVEKDIKNGSSKKNITKIISLVNIDSKSLENILKNIMSNRVYKKSKPSISIDEKNNLIIIDGKKEEVLNLVNIIKQVDIPKLQVYIKANIIEVDDNKIEEIGINYGIFGGSTKSGNLYTFSSSLNDGKAIVIDSSSINLDIPNITSSLALGASLNLLGRTYALNIISEPSILCMNNMQSSIYVGETVSIQTASTTTDGGTTKNSFKREDIGLTLKVKPRISNKNRVFLEINTTVEGIKNINSVSLNPDTTKKELITKAILNNGESVIIGGLLENRSEKRVQKIPLASDIPLIGELFKNRFYNKHNKNLVVIVTPYIIPQNKDLTYIRNELSKLKGIEDKFLEDVLIDLRNKKRLSSSKSVSSNKKQHTKLVDEYFNN